MDSRLTDVYVQTLIVLIGLSTTVTGLYLEPISSNADTSPGEVVLPTAVDKTAQKQVTLPDVFSFVERMYSTVEATDKEVKALTKRLDDIDALIKSPEKSTDNPSETIKPKEKVFFLYTKVKKNWFEAYVDCHTKEMSLASIETEEEYQKVLSQIKLVDKKENDKSEDFWLGGTDLGQDGNTYVWLSTYRNVTYHKWYRSQTSHQPDHYTQVCSEGEHCMELNQNLHNEMNDYCCSNRQNYVCEQWN